ncbi:MAG: hypothetical protein CL607_28175 [Anaerolineaceae bacterium]|nr:hypothetical protein [Anaerolineaceae bacterium]
MKRKATNWSRRILKVHTAIFMIGVIAMFYGVLAGILYPGNASVSADMWRSLSAERTSMALMWLAILLAHMVAVFSIEIMRRWQRRRHEAFIYDAHHDSEQPEISRLIDSDPTQSDYTDHPNQSHGSLTHN